MEHIADPDNNDKKDQQLKRSLDLIWANNLSLLVQRNNF